MIAATQGAHDDIQHCRPGFADVQVLRESADRVCDDDWEINRAALDIFHIQIPKLRYVLIPRPSLAPDVDTRSGSVLSVVRQGGAAGVRPAVD
ncbi:hypothetical protein BST24_15455 [Mycobacteroides franklinii]|nr:hypothetical protein BST24_15455 [Mycobacteroides franklinii]